MVPSWQNFVRMQIFSFVILMRSRGISPTRILFLDYFANLRFKYKVREDFLEEPCSLVVQTTGWQAGIPGSGPSGAPGDFFLGSGLKK